MVRSSKIKISFPSLVADLCDITIKYKRGIPH